jgi:hypothetical protein
MPRPHQLRLILLVCIVSGACITSRAAPAQAQAPSSQRQSSAKTGPTDREFFQELYDRGEFLEDEKIRNPDGWVVGLKRALNTDYVCFSNDAHSGRFFTFIAWAYDENYSAAGDRGAAALGFSESRRVSDADMQKQVNAMQAIQKSAPYVHFIAGDQLEAYPPDAQKFFQAGGRVLIVTNYEKGARRENLHYREDGDNLWFATVSTTGAAADDSRPSKVLSISIDPPTMHYTESATVEETAFTTASGVRTATSEDTGAGACEKIPEPKR